MKDHFRLSGSICSSWSISKCVVLWVWVWVWMGCVDVDVNKNVGFTEQIEVDGWISGR